MARMSDPDPKPAESVEETPAPAPAVDPLDGPDNEWVRVKHPTNGTHYSTTRALARIEGATLLPDHEALSPHGVPLPPKYKTELSEES